MTINHYPALPIAFRKRHGTNLGYLFQFNQRGILFARPAFPKRFVQSVELEGEIPTNLCQDGGGQLIKLCRLGERQPHNRSSASLYQDDVICIDGEIRRPAVDTETRLDRLYTREHRSQERLYEDRQVHPDLDLGGVEL